MMIVQSFRAVVKLLIIFPLISKLVLGSCHFPRELQGSWQYTDRNIKMVRFSQTSVSFHDDHFRVPWIKMKCYKNAGDIYLLRAPKIFSLNVDAVLCVRIFKKLSEPLIYEVDVPQGRRTFLEQIRLSRTEPSIPSDCQYIIKSQIEANHLYGKNSRK